MKHCREKLSFHSIMETCSLTNFFSPQENILLTVRKTNLLSETWPNQHLLVRIQQHNSSAKLCSKLTIEATDVVLVSLPLTLSKFEMFLVFFYWIWACKCRTQYFIVYLNLLLYLNLSMCFRVRFKSPDTFKAKLTVTFNNSFQLLSAFGHKELHPRCCIGNSPRCPKNIFQEVFRIKFFLFKIKWTKWS